MTTPIGGTPAAPGGNALGATTLNDKGAQQTTFPTLNPPTMKTLVYAPNVRILIGHGLQTIDISPDIVRGQVALKENSCSSLFVELANPKLRYNHAFSRMDRVTVYLTGPRGELQVFSGYLDTVPYTQAYPGTIFIRATCTLKRLLHTWWNPALPESIALFDQMSANFGTAGDGQGQTDTGLGSLLRNLMVDVAKWPVQNVHIQNFPQHFLIFLNNYFTTNGIMAKNAEIGEQFKRSILGSDTSPGPMGGVGYRGSDPIGATAPGGIGAIGAGQAFYLQQIVAACDQRGLGPIATTDVNSQTVLRSGEALQASRDQAVQTAGEQTSQYALDQTLQNKDSDAAILAAACVQVESNWRMLANQTVPDSLTMQNDGLGNNLDSVGLFQQRNNGQWGTVQQRMNAYASAGMFFDRLVAVTGGGWRNMDEGTAIYQVQVGASPLTYAAAIPAAKKLVQAYRLAKDGGKQTLDAAAGAIPGVSTILTATGGADIVSSAVNAATNSPTPQAAVRTALGKPEFDSEGAIQAAAWYLGTPYSQTIGGGNTPGVGLDCSGLVQAAFKSIGISLPRTTYTQITGIPRIVPASAAQRGDILQTNGGGHTGIYLGGGSWINTGGPDGQPGRIEPINPATCYAVLRACPNGGYNPAAPFTPLIGQPAGSLPGTAPGAAASGGSSDSSNESIARNLFSYQFLPGAYASQTALMYTGEKRFIDAQPLIQMVQAVAAAGLRNFQSAPNGDFIAYYPDHFGMDGKKAIMNVEDIELTDISITISDDPMATHVYVNGDYTMIGESDQALGWLITAGVATVENEALYRQLASIAPGDIDANMTAKDLMEKFGVRPLKQSYQMASNPALEFLIACQIFMGKWSAQYSTDIGITYMPELRPGMRINFPKHDLQVYVSAVTHTFDWERGFSTAASVGAASKPSSMRTIYTSVPGGTTPSGNITALQVQQATSSTGTPTTNPDYIPPAPGANPVATNGNGN